MSDPANSRVSGSTGRCTCMGFESNVHECGFLYDCNTPLGTLRLSTENPVIFTKDVTWYGLLGESSLSGILCVGTFSLTENMCKLANRYPPWNFHFGMGVLSL